MTWHAQFTLAMGPLHLDVTLEGDQRPVALIGPNGSGKTTILRTIAGAHRPATGRILVDDRVVFDAAKRIDQPPEARHVGYVPQGHGLFPHLSVLDNVGFGCHEASGRAERRQAAAVFLAEMDALDLAQRPVPTLSGGEQQRVALARALITTPSVLLLDEPLSAMDAQARRSLRTYLATHLSQRGVPALVATHDARDVRALNAMVYAIEGGRVVQSGSADALAADPATPFIAEFFDSGEPTRSEPEPPSA